MAANPRRPVRDRCYYDPVVASPALLAQGSSDINDDIADCRPAFLAKGVLDEADDSPLPSPKKPRRDDTTLDSLIPVSRRERSILLKEAATSREPVRSVHPRASKSPAVEDMLFLRKVPGFSSTSAPADRVPNDPDDPVVAREIEDLRRK